MSRSQRVARYWKRCHLIHKVEEEWELALPLSVTASHRLLTLILILISIEKDHTEMKHQTVVTEFIVLGFASRCE